MFDKAYLIRAFYQWATDHHYEITMKISTKHPSYSGNLVQDYIEDDGSARVVISNNKIKYFEIEKDKVSVSKYDKENNLRSISIGMDGIEWLSANGEYLHLDHKCGYISGLVKSRAKEVQKSRKAEEQRKKEKRGMDPSVINEWVEKNKQKYIEMMQLDDWQIHILVVTQNSSESKGMYRIAGNCEKNYKYSIATIRLFSNNILDEDRLCRTLVHELAHVATASVDRYMEYVESIACLSGKQLEFARKIEAYTYELLATRIERIILGKNALSAIIDYEDDIDKKITSCLEEYVDYKKPEIILEKNDKILLNEAANENLYDKKIILLGDKKAI